jgi:hypothetical protein
MLKPHVPSWTWPPALVRHVDHVIGKCRMNSNRFLARSSCNRLFGDTLQVREELPRSHSPALQFQVQATSGPQARTAQMKLPHFLCETPMFMPVGTKGMVNTPCVDSAEAALPTEPFCHCSAFSAGGDNKRYTFLNTVVSVV